MKKERTRFDAIAEELEEPEKPQRKTLTKKAKDRLDKIVDGYKPKEPVEVVPMDWDDEVTPPEAIREYNFPPPPQPTLKRKGRPKAVRTETNAYLSAMGQIWPVIEFRVSTHTRDEIFRDPYDARLDRNMNILSVTMKVAGRLDEKTVRDGEPALVVTQGDAEPNYFRLDIHEWRWTVTSADTSYVEIEAYARQLQ